MNKQEQARVLRKVMGVQGGEGGEGSESGRKRLVGGQGQGLRAQSKSLSFISQTTGSHHWIFSLGVTCMNLWLRAESET